LLEEIHHARESYADRHRCHAMLPSGSSGHDMYTNLKNRAGKSCCDDNHCRPATTWGIHPEFGEVVAVRTAEGAVLVSERSFLHELRD